MGVFDSIKGMYGAAVGICTVCGAIGAAAIYLADYKKKLDIIDELQARIAKLEARAPSAVGSIGPQGERGSEGKPGRQGDPGPQGERGPVGPKGEVGIVPTQIAEFDRRLSLLERRGIAPANPSGATTAASPTGPQVASADASTTASMPPGLSRNADGCLFFAPGFQSASGTFSVNDRFCTIDGQSSMTITRISDDRIVFRYRYGESSCPMEGAGGRGCNVPLTQGIYFMPKKPLMDRSGNISAEVAFEKRTEAPGRAHRPLPP